MLRETIVLASLPGAKHADTDIQIVFHPKGVHFVHRGGAGTLLSTACRKTADGGAHSDIGDPGGNTYVGDLVVPDQTALIDQRTDVSERLHWATRS